MITDSFFFLSIFLPEGRKVPAIVDGKKTDQAGGCEAEDCREQDIHSNSQEEAVNDSSDDGGEAIYTLSHDERHLPGEDVAQHSAADSGENSDEGTEK